MHVEIGQEGHLQQPLHVGIAVDRLGDAVDEADDQLGHGITGSRLAAEDHGARRQALGLAVLDAQVTGDHAQGIEMLTLVFVNPLHLHVKQAGGVDQQAIALVDHGGEPALAGQLAGSPALQEGLVVLEGFQPLQRIDLGRPVGTHGLTQQIVERWIGQGQPAPGGDPVGHVGELLGPDRRKLGKQIALDQVAVQGRHAIDVMAAHHGQMGHAHGFGAALIDDRHPPEDLVIARVAQPHLLQKAGIDLIDQLEMPGQQGTEQVKAPALQSFGQQGVVGVRQ